MPTTPATVRKLRLGSENLHDITKKNGKLVFAAPSKPVWTVPWQRSSAKQLPGGKKIEVPAFKLVNKTDDADVIAKLQKAVEGEKDTYTIFHYEIGELSVFVAAVGSLSYLRPDRAA